MKSKKTVAPHIFTLAMNDHKTKIKKRSRQQTITQEIAKMEYKRKKKCHNKKIGIFEGYE